MKKVRLPGGGKGRGNRQKGRTVREEGASERNFAKKGTHLEIYKEEGARQGLKPRHLRKKSVKNVQEGHSVPRKRVSGRPERVLNFL